jgi:hypothetical protein
METLDKKLLEIRNKINTFEKEFIAEKTRRFVELKKEENKILCEMIEMNKKLIELTKEETLDMWTLLHSP